MRAWRNSSFGFALCVALAACSALPLDEFERLPCNVHGEPSPCDALNADLPAGQCAKYYCSASGFGCELRPRDDDGDKHADAKTCATEPDLGDLDCDDGDKLRYFGGRETCDRVDNDCNGFIDEGPLEDISTTETPAGPEVVQVSRTSSRDDTLYLALTNESRPGHFDTSRLVLAGTDFIQPLALSSEPPAEEGADVPLCNLRDTLGDHCNFAQLAIAATDDLLIGAGINRSGCVHGQLRVGVGSAAAFDLGLSSDPPASNVAFGIDVEADTCTHSGPCRGASDPALAVLPATDESGAQALAVWRAPTDDCATGSSTSHIAALGLFVKEAAGGPILMGTAQGHSEDLGPSVGSGPPAIAAFVGDTTPGGYFVAYAARKQIELRFIPKLSTTESLEAEILSGNIDAPGADAVALTLDTAATDTPRSLALAFRADPESGPAIVFTELAFERARAPHLTAASKPVTIKAEGAILGGPSLAYAPAGFSTEDSAIRPGGWLVAWVEQTTDGKPDARRLMAVRIAEAGPRQLGPATELARGPIGQPFTFSQQGRTERPSLHYGYVTEEKLRIGEITCPDGRQ